MLPTAALLEHLCDLAAVGAAPEHLPSLIRVGLLVADGNAAVPFVARGVPPGTRLPAARDHLAYFLSQWLLCFKTCDVKGSCFQGPSCVSGLFWRRRPSAFENDP
jgi:hypothetical protein